MNISDIKHLARVARWNGGPVPEELGGGTRNNTKLDLDYEIALLTDEIKEFYTALANNDLVEMIDGYCDTKFVKLGIDFKYGMQNYAYNSSTNLVVLKTSIEGKAYIDDLYNEHTVIMLEVLGTYGITQQMLDECFDVVCEANEQKGTVKNEFGKTIKGPKWVNPADKIRLIIEANQSKLIVVGDELRIPNE